MLRVTPCSESQVRLDVLCDTKGSRRSEMMLRAEATYLAFFAPGTISESRAPRSSGRRSIRASMLPLKF